MDMSMTRAVATIIQAVSPVSSFGAAAGAAGAASAAVTTAGASSANAGTLMHKSAAISIMMLINFFMIIPPCV
jgi:hypothetical protein